jgi:hypothetical protein
VAVAVATTAAYRKYEVELFRSVGHLHACSSGANSLVPNPTPPGALEQLPTTMASKFAVTPHALAALDAKWAQVSQLLGSASTMLPNRPLLLHFSSRFPMSAFVPCFLDACGHVGWVCSMLHTNMHGATADGVRIVAIECFELASLVGRGLSC